MITFFKKNKDGQEGFTLVEVMVAIFIFAITLSVMFSVLGNGISNLTFSKKKTTAQYLAQEGIEYVRNIRDTEVLDADSTNPGIGWGDFLAKFPQSECGNGTTGCYFDPTNINFTNPIMPITAIPIYACVSGGMGCAHLRYLPSTGSYNYSQSGADSGFVRIIKVESDIDDAEISSTVYWTSNGATHSTSFSEDLYNWVN
jgi:prepilin-type N-terminal cleavage/methylation domain-containing protein